MKRKERKENENSCNVETVTMERFLKDKNQISKPLKDGADVLMKDFLLLFGQVLEAIVFL